MDALKLQHLLLRELTIYSSSPNTSGIEAQEEMMFQFKSKKQEKTSVPDQRQSARRILSYSK